MPRDSKQIWDWITTFFTSATTSGSSETPCEDSEARIHSANDATSKTKDDAGRANSTFTSAQPFMTKPSRYEPSYATGQTELPQVKTYSPEMSSAKVFFRSDLANTTMPAHKKVQKHLGNLGNPWTPRDTVGQRPIPATSGKLLPSATSAKRKSVEQSPSAPYGRQTRFNGSQHYATDSQPESILKKRRTSLDEHEKVHASPVALRGHTTPYSSPHLARDSSHKRPRTTERDDIHTFDMSNSEYHTVERMVRSSKASSEERHRRESTSDDFRSHSPRNVILLQDSQSLSQSSKLLHEVIDGYPTLSEASPKLSQHKQKRRRARLTNSPPKTFEAEPISDSDAEKESFPPRDLPGRKDFSKSLQGAYPSMTLPFEPWIEKEGRKESPTPRGRTPPLPSADTGSPESLDELQLGERQAAKDRHAENDFKTFEGGQRRSTHPSRSRHFSTEDSGSNDESNKPQAFARTNFVRQTDVPTQTKNKRTIGSSKTQLPDVMEIPFYELSVGQNTCKGHQQLRLALDEPGGRFRAVYTQMRKTLPLTLFEIRFDILFKATFGKDGSRVRLEYSKRESEPGGRPDQFIEFWNTKDQAVFIERLSQLAPGVTVRGDKDDHLQRVKDKKLQEVHPSAGKKSTTEIKGDPEELKLLEARVAQGKFLNRPNSVETGSKTLKRKDLLQSKFEPQNHSESSIRRSSRRTHATDKAPTGTAERPLPPERSSRRLKENPRKTADSPSEIHEGSATVEKYSEMHGLGEPWKESLVFPPEGPNKVTVDFEDLKRLDEEEFLNDNLIQFFLRYSEGLRDKESSRAKVHIFNTYFYSTLTNTEKGSKSRINYERVKRWTSKIDLFTYDYAIVPINEAHHWYAAIICNLRNLPTEFSSQLPSQDVTFNHLLDDAEPEGRPSTSDENALPDSPTNENRLSQSYSKLSIDAVRVGPKQHSRSDRAEQGLKGKEHTKRAVNKGDPSQPVIIMLDSFGIPRNEASRNLKDYLREEGKEKKQVDFADPPGVNAKGLPTQINFADCGIYVIGYIQQFLRNPREFVTRVVQRGYNGNEDWGEFDPKKMRNEFRDLLQDKYHRQARAKQKLGRRPESPEKEKASDSTAIQRETKAVAVNVMETSPRRPKIRIDRSLTPENASAPDKAGNGDDEDMLDQGEESVVILNSQTKPTGSDTFLEQLQSAAAEEVSSHSPKPRPESRHRRTHSPHNTSSNSERDDDPIL